MHRIRLHTLALAVVLSPGAAEAAPAVIAIADFDYRDTSGEPRDQTTAHAARLAAFTADIAAALDKTGRFTTEKLACAQPPCSAANMTQQDITDAARAQHANLLLFGGVHKMSTLIQWGQVEVMDVATGKRVLSHTVTFRGDSEEAWRHASDYVAKMVAGELKG